MPIQHAGCIWSNICAPSRNGVCKTCFNGVSSLFYNMIYSNTANKNSVGLITGITLILMKYHEISQWLLDRTQPRLLKKTKSGERLYGLKDGFTAVDIENLARRQWFMARDQVGWLMRLTNGKVIENTTRDRVLHQITFLLWKKIGTETFMWALTAEVWASFLKMEKIKNFPLTNNECRIVIFNIHCDNEEKFGL